MSNRNSNPLVSIILPMYNAAETIVDSLDSIIQQTYTNLEIIIIDDGSTDNSVEIVKSYNDKRIKIYQYKHNYIRNLNRAFLHCNGVYIARMDADDRMCRMRIEKQVAIMERYANVSVCCSIMKPFGEKRTVKCGIDGIMPNLKVYFLCGNFLYHPTIMLRKTLLQEGFKYKSAYIYAEDYKLWVDMALKDVVFYKISEALVEYRVSENQVSHIYNKEQTMTAWLIRQELLEALIKQCPQPLRKNIRKLYSHLLNMNQDGLISPKAFYDVFANIFQHIVEKEQL